MILLAVLLPRLAEAQNCPAQKPGRYQVKVDSSPQGATVYIGDKACGPVGNTPWTGKLNKGEVQVIIETPGYQPETKRFKVGALRKLQTLFVPLTRQPQIEISPSADPNLVGATIFVDGVSQGVIQGPVTIKTTAGRHQIEIKKAGFEDLSQWVDLSATPALTLTPQLRKKAEFGAILVDADVKDAEIFVDGNKHPDTTPSIIQNVTVGMHTIEVKKGPATWKGTVQVVANQQAKITGQLANQGYGVIRVISDTKDAEVFIDGAPMGKAPVDIKDVKPGEHILQVKAPNMQPSEKRVVVTAGQNQVVKFDLAAEAAKDQGTLKVISTIPDAEVVIDGAVVGKVPQEKKLSAGKHPVMVRLTGYKPYEEIVVIEPGKTVTITAELKGVGRLRILSSPSGATVLINGLPAKNKDGTEGKTPLDIEVETGKTIVRLEYPNRVAFEETIDIKGGQTETISRELAEKGKSEEELESEQKGLSSWGARVLPRGRSTVDFDAGYPYYAGIRISVGAGRLTRQWGFDATVAARTLFSRNELGLGARMMVANQNPFSAALFSNFWFGSSLLDNSQRNGVTWDAGVIASLTALSNVTISGRAYFQFWSDRHCPEIRGSAGSARFLDDAEPTEECEAYLSVTNGGAPTGSVTDKDIRKMELLTGEEGVDMFGRENGARFLISVIAEIAVDQRWNVFGQLEGAPFQDERALFTNLFSGSMPEKDVNLYGRIGLSYKF